MDGTCNNLENTLWGSTNTPYIRLGPAYYNDSKWSTNIFLLKFKLKLIKQPDDIIL